MNFNSRLRAIRKLIKDNHLDAVLVTSVPNIIYLTGYTGFSQEEREAFLFLTQDAQYILTDGRYSTAVKKSVPNFTLIEIASIHPFREVIEELVKKHNIKELGIEENNLLVHEYKIILQMVSKTKHIPITQIRMKKEDQEIAAIEKACQLGDKAFEYILKKIKPGISEKDIAWELEKYIKEHGATLSFDTIVAFGPNAAVPHHQTNNSSLITHNFILIDFGIKLDNYFSDMTRTLFFGKPNDEQKRMYQTVINAQQKAIEFIETNCHSERSEESIGENETRSFSRLSRDQDDEVLKASDVDKAARNYITIQGYPTIPHSLGHGIGLQVHEKPTLSPVSNDVLEGGMVFSIEPGIYLPAGRQGIPPMGVRIEDLFVIEEQRLRQLTKSKKTLLEI